MQIKQKYSLSKLSTYYFGHFPQEKKKNEQWLRDYFTYLGNFIYSLAFLKEL